MLRKIFEPVSEKVMGGSKKQHNESFILCFSPNNIRVMNSRKVRWVWRIACMGVMSNSRKYFGKKKTGIEEPA
jgi:hypothetical protein